GPQPGPMGSGATAARPRGALVTAPVAGPMQRSSIAATATTPAVRPVIAPVCALDDPRPAELPTAPPGQSPARCRTTALLPGTSTTSAGPGAEALCQASTTSSYPSD